ncbi:mycothione reductase [Corynebacterium coyleae]|uniref:Mycothione reductase n=1 Tax=Corynebacterium coyleae TaxID=53374 RepID=A0ABX8KV99_9CORY|nr:mycothione reductase [Corynebacterium coyleae]QXB18616.1 mycothione reductase [Corynebacterium coyleae]WJY80138.1 Mycothione reductase [Corynebacterium coyleae]SEB38404.1 mycothione reductase [Corynebacterium coyleae]
MSAVATNSTHYDLIIVGTGSGNSILTPDFDDKKVAIVEKGKFGGTCLNVGCIPTKMYVLAAEHAFAAREAGKLGVDLEFHGADWDAIKERVFDNRIDLIAKGGENYRRNECDNVTVYDMEASFVEPKTLKTGRGGLEETITADTIILAAGARPFIPEWAKGVTYHTNEDVMRLNELPKSMTIVGGGFIAMEFAHVFDALGTDVTIISRSPLLRPLDEDLRDPFNEIATQRYTTHIGRTVASATEDGGQVTLTLDDDTQVTSDALLIATGRIPNSDTLNVAAGGIETHDDGRVKVDEFGRTTAEGVWSLGDLSSPYQLKHVANAEMRAVTHNVLATWRGNGALVPMPHDHVPSAIFTHPQIATVGLTEQQAIEAGHDVTVKVQNYGDVAYGWALEDSTGLVKLIADRTTGKLLGAHYMGPQASTLIQQMITVMAYDLDLREFPRSQYWIHPALAEVTENAILGLDLTFKEV